MTALNEQRHAHHPQRLAPATVKAQGAELCSLRDAAGLEFVWQAGPVWPRHAPLLFPIVGRLANDELRHRGKTYRMTQHGFARDSRFVWAERGENSCVLVLEDSETTRALYPFAFRLVVAYTLDKAGLDVTLTSSTPASRHCRPRSAVIPPSTGRFRPGCRRRITR